MARDLFREQAHAAEHHPAGRSVLHQGIRAISVAWMTPCNVRTFPATPPAKHDNVANPPTCDGSCQEQILENPVHRFPKRRKRAVKSTLLFCNGDPGRTRTPNILIRSQVLYPVELRDRAGPLMPQVMSQGKWSERAGHENTEWVVHIVTKWRALGKPVCLLGGA